MLIATQQSFLNWLLDPREAKTVRSFPEGTEAAKGTQAQLAAHLGVTPLRLTQWKKDPEFVAEWQAKLTEVSGGPERLAAHLQRLDDIAMGRATGARPQDSNTAIRLHAEMVGTFTPKREVKINDPSLARTSDSELLAEIDEMRAILHAKVKLNGER